MDVCNSFIHWNNSKLRRLPPNQPPFLFVHEPCCQKYLETVSSRLFLVTVLTRIKAGPFQIYYNIIIFWFTLLSAYKYALLLEVKHMSIRRPTHLKEDLVIAFLTVLAITIVMVLWPSGCQNHQFQWLFDSSTVWSILRQIISRMAR